MLPSEVVISVPASYPNTVLYKPEPEVMLSPAFVPPTVFPSESELNPPPPPPDSAAHSRPVAVLLLAFKT